MLARPFLADLSCDAGDGGNTLCAHSLDMEPSPPYAVAYSQVVLAVPLAWTSVVESGIFHRNCKQGTDRDGTLARCALRLVPSGHGGDICITRERVPVQRISNSRMLAVADEDGYVSCLNTDKPLPSTLDPELAEHGVEAQWLAHDNAIFDLCWTDVRA